MNATPAVGPPGGRPGRVMIVLAFALLVAAAALLWGRFGPSIFADMVLAGLAWCF